MKRLMLVVAILVGTAGTVQAEPIPWTPAEQPEELRNRCGLKPLKPLKPLGCKRLELQCWCDKPGLGGRCKWQWICIS